MARGMRLRCNCGKAVNAVPNQICPKCKKLIDVPKGSMIYLYRPFSLKFLCSGFDIYLNGLFYGRIGGGEYVKIPVNFGEYKLRIIPNSNSLPACFLGKYPTMDLQLTPQTPAIYIKTSVAPYSLYKLKFNTMSNEEIKKTIKDGDCI